MLGSQHPGVVTLYNNIGQVYREQVKYEEALLHHHNSLQINILVHGHIHLHGAMSKHKIGLPLKDMGKKGDAKDVFTQAAAIRRSIFGAHHLLTIESERRAAE